MTILVCPLSQAMSVVAARVPERIVSLLDPDFTFPDFGSGYADRHLRIRLHDVQLTTGDQGDLLPPHLLLPVSAIRAQTSLR
jgi:predicted protein tyrosine phosphatase